MKREKNVIDGGLWASNVLNTKNHLSNYLRSNGWICLRVSAMGDATKYLKREGWIKVDHAGINNRNGFDWMKSGFTLDEARVFNWSKYSKLGLVGIAFWMSRSQVSGNHTFSSLQWVSRAIIDKEFNEKYPTGRR